MANDDNYWQHVMDERGVQGPQDGASGIPYAPQAQQPGVPDGQGMPVQQPGAPDGQGMPAQQQGLQDGQGMPVQQPGVPDAQGVPAGSQAAPQVQGGSAPTPAGSAQDAGPAPSWQASPRPYAAVQPAYGTADTPAPKSHGWIVAIVIVLAIAGVVFYSIGSCSSMFGSLYSRNGSSSLDTLTGDTVGIISLSGTIQYDNSACSPEGLKELLDRAEENDHIKAVVLRVDSGGGTATAGEEMAEYVKDFGKPIVVSSASINASAAYEISSQADYIYVAKSTEIGAIGTAMQVTDLSGLLDKLGVNMETIASSDSKDSSYGFRELTEEERVYYQEMVNQINEVFIQNVADGRNMDVKDVRALATGMPFTGLTSVENGLADEVGTREDALDKAAELAGITGSYDTVYIDFDYYDLTSLYTLLGSSRSADDVLSGLGVDDAGAHIR